MLRKEREEAASEMEAASVAMEKESEMLDEAEGKAQKRSLAEKSKEASSLKRRRLSEPRGRDECGGFFGEACLSESGASSGEDAEGPPLRNLRRTKAGEEQRIGSRAPGQEAGGSTSSSSEDDGSRSAKATLVTARPVFGRRKGKRRCARGRARKT